jgi:predicted HTH transcriptional regulator
MLIKMHETFCAFLNSAGGYFIVGIIDETRKVRGIPRSLVDTLLLDVDSVIHERTIVNTTTGLLVNSDSICASICPIEGSENVLVIVRVASSDPSHVFVMNSGIRIFRLNASNAKILTSDNNNVLALQNKISTLTKTNALVIESNNLISSHLKGALVRCEETSIALGKAKENLDEVVDLLYTKILEEKMKAEVAYMQERKLALGFIFGFDCFRNSC